MHFRRYRCLKILAIAFCLLIGIFSYMKLVSRTIRWTTNDHNQKTIRTDNDDHCTLNQKQTFDGVCERKVTKRKDEVLLLLLINTIYSDD